MKTGLGLSRKYRKLIAYINLFRFTIRKYIIGFDSANLFIQRVDKISIQLILINNGAKIGDKCNIDTGLVFHNCKNYKNLKIGNNCHIGKNCFFDLRNEILIENNVVISMQCSFITHLDMTKSDLSKLYPSISKRIIINKNCYLGVRTTILMGVELGKSCLIASSSLVNKNVAPYNIVGGVPVKTLKMININTNLSDDDY